MADSVTAPTPEQAAAVRWLTSVAQFGRRTDITKEQAAAICASLAAATAERDQARQMLADAEQKIASMELDASLRGEDERFADPL